MGVKQIQLAKENPMPTVAMGTGLIITIAGFYTMMVLGDHQIGPILALIGYVLQFAGMFSSRRYKRVFSRTLKHYIGSSAKVTL